jgi:hypothetical protein
LLIESGSREFLGAKLLYLRDEVVGCRKPAVFIDYRERRDCRGALVFSILDAHDNGPGELSRDLVSGSKHVFVAFAGISKMGRHCSQVDASHLRGGGGGVVFHGSIL